MGIASGFFCGNLNVVEYRLDKSSRCRRLMSDKEKLTWVHLYDKKWV